MNALRLTWNATYEDGTILVEEATPNVGDGRSCCYTATYVKPTGEVTCDFTAKTLDGKNVFETLLLDREICKDDVRLLCFRHYNKNVRKLFGIIS